MASAFALRRYEEWCLLLAVSVATLLTVRVWDHGRFSIGLIVPPRLAVIDAALGVLFAMFLIVTGDALIVLFSHVRESWSGGFPARDVLVVFLPAALHEELAFRGYCYQKMRLWSRPVAIAFWSLVFAVLHGGNAAVSPLAIVNIFIAGILLALAYEQFRRLWFPIGIHFAWNVLSGPILGFPVSGFATRRSVMRVWGTGPLLVTGGAFGVEGSLCMTAVEIAGIAILLWSVRRRE